jgi:hypothetical protein
MQGFVGVGLQFPSEAFLKILTLSPAKLPSAQDIVIRSEITPMLKSFISYPRLEGDRLTGVKSLEGFEFYN